MRVPLSTYRLQFNSSFTFKDALKVIPYLERLGISDVYASPVFKARKGSIHGYDIVDNGSLNPELGDEKEFADLMAGVRSLSMGWIQDIVANHMAYDPGNTLLMDIMEKGANSRYSDFFDIEWEPTAYEGIKGRLLAPFLGKIYAEALEGGEIKLAYGPDGFTAGYWGFVFPLRIESYSTILGRELKKLRSRIGKRNPDFIKFLGILYVLKNLPQVEPDELSDQVSFVKSILNELYEGSPDVRSFLDENIAAFNGAPGDPDSFTPMDKLLSEQVFKFSFWKVAAEEINYRRFFNINELITLRVESEPVYNKVHSYIFRLARDHGITGFRIDHIDGLYNPLNYLLRLRERVPDAYVVVEKILGREEELRQGWPVEGTTGYDFLNRLNSIFCDPADEAPFTRAYAAFTGIKSRFSDLFYEKKKLITEMDMISDVGNLAQLLKSTLRDDRYGTDITLPGIKRAIVAVMAAFPVYRTYVCRESRTGEDLGHINEAVKRSLQMDPALQNELGYIGKVLRLEYGEYLSEEKKNEWLHFAMRFQQFTGPLMAKGFEDTLLYVYNRLISLNEVGGTPGRFGAPLQEFHAFNERRAHTHPHSMSATSTHDTKRGEDARARINVLSEMPEDWAARLKTWASMNRKKKKAGNGGVYPDRNDEYFFYQTLMGAWPLGDGDGDHKGGVRKRLKDYMIKAVRETKIHTAWLRPDTEYEESFVSFIDAVLNDPVFMKDFLPFQEKTAWHGFLNSLSQTLMKITAPGVPDFYQGTELWDFSFVDPDNRRPVDFEKRASLLEEIIKRKNDPVYTDELASSWRDGRVKLFLIYRALEIRRAKAGLFTYGSYLPLSVEGLRRNNVIAFARVKEDDMAVTVVPRFTSRLAGTGALPAGHDVWKDTRVVLPEEVTARVILKDTFTGEKARPPANGRSIDIGSLLNRFPAALLTKE